MSREVNWHHSLKCTCEKEYDVKIIIELPTESVLVSDDDGVKLEIRSIRVETCQI